MVTDKGELIHWCSKGKISKPADWRSFKQSGVELKRGDSVDLLFKFITFREFTFSESVEASGHIIKPRNIIVVVKTDNRQVKSLKLHIMPGYAPIDHVFRYYEPEQSHF